MNLLKGVIRKCFLPHLLETDKIYIQKRNIFSRNGFYFPETDNFPHNLHNPNIIFPLLSKGPPCGMWSKKVINKQGSPLPLITPFLP